MIFYASAEICSFRGVDSVLRCKVLPHRGGDAFGIHHPRLRNAYLGLQKCGIFDAMSYRVT